MTSKYAVHVSLLKDLQIAFKNFKKAMKGGNDESTPQLQFLKISKSLFVMFKAKSTDPQLNSLKKEAENIVKQYQILMKSRESREVPTEILINSFEVDNEVYNNPDELNSKLAEMRKEEISRLHNDMIELNGIFKDMAGLVDDQGKMLEEIRVEVDVAERTTGRAVTDLEEAKHFDQQSRRKKCCIILIAIIVLSAVGGIIAGVIISK